MKFGGFCQKPLYFTGLQPIARGIIKRGPRKNFYFYFYTEELPKGVPRIRAEQALNKVYKVYILNIFRSRKTHMQS